MSRPPPPPEFIAQFCEFINPSFSRFNIDVNTLSTAKRSSINPKDQQIEQDKLDNALATLLSSLLSTFVQPSDVFWLLQQLGYPRMTSLSTPDNSLQERLIALSWLVAEFDLWEKHTLDNVTHVLHREHITNIPLFQQTDCLNHRGSTIVPSSSSSSDHGLHWGHPKQPTVPSQHNQSSTTDHESLVAAYGQVNHLLRKYKHLRTCHVRNTQTLTRSIRRMLDQSCHTTSTSSSVHGNTTTSGTTTSSPSLEMNNHALSDGWKVTNATDAVLLLRSLPMKELEKLVHDIDHSYPSSHISSLSPADQALMDLEHTLMHLSETLEQQVHTMKRVSVTDGLEHSRQQEAAYYRWISSCKTLESHPTGLDSHGIHDVDDDEVVPVEILNELERVLEMILGDVLTGGMIAPPTGPTGIVPGNGNGTSGNSVGGKSSNAGIDVYRICSDAEIELCNDLPGLTPNRSRHNRQSFTKEDSNTFRDGTGLVDKVMMDHPMYRHHYHRLSTMTLPRAKIPDQDAMISLRTIHRDVLHRTAKACSPYSPYDIQFT